VTRLKIFYNSLFYTNSAEQYTKANGGKSKQGWVFFHPKSKRNKYIVQRREQPKQHTGISENY